MNILFDTNILLDVLFNRKQFVENSSLLVSAAETNKITGFLCATTITTLDYLICKQTTRNRAKSELKKLLTIFNIAEVNSKVINNALNSNFTDFEDAVQYYSGKNILMDGLVTRNIKDYKAAQLPIYSPEEMIAIIQNN